MALPYAGNWDTAEEMCSSFNIPISTLDGATVLIASYTGVAYEGDAWVILERNGKLFEVHGSHCSCYGLEDQWGEEATSWEALRMRISENKKEAGLSRWCVPKIEDDEQKVLFLGLVWTNLSDANIESLSDETRLSLASCLAGLGSGEWLERWLVKVPVEKRDPILAKLLADGSRTVKINTVRVWGRVRRQGESVSVDTTVKRPGK